MMELIAQPTRFLQAAPLTDQIIPHRSVGGDYMSPMDMESKGVQSLPILFTQSLRTSHRERFQQLSGRHVHRGRSSGVRPPTVPHSRRHGYPSQAIPRPIGSIAYIHIGQDEQKL